MKRFLPQAILFIVVLVAASLAQPLSHMRALATPGDCMTFKETGKSICGRFLQYWQRNGGLAQQGFPLSNTFTEASSVDGHAYIAQYFERAVFEYHPENPVPNDVLLSLLGALRFGERYTYYPRSQTPNTQAGSRIFPQTGKRLGGLFLGYWNAHGGLAQQGFPVSDEFEEVSDVDGVSYHVQYFERAVFEYHPSNPVASQVLLSLVGVSRYQRNYTASSVLPEVPPPSAVAGQGSGASSPLPSAVPTPTPIPPRVSGARLEVVDWNIYDANYPNSGLHVVGIAKNTGGVALGFSHIIAILKDAGGHLVDTDYAQAPGGMAPGDIYPFHIDFPPDTPTYTSVNFQIELREYTAFQKTFTYRDLQVIDYNIQVLPPSSFDHGVTILGTLKNTGSAICDGSDIYVAVLDGSGKLIDVGHSWPLVEVLAPGATSPFKIEMSNSEQAASVKFAAYGHKK